MSLKESLKPLNLRRKIRKNPYIAALIFVLGGVVGAIAQMSAQQLISQALPEIFEKDTLELVAGQRQVISAIQSNLNELEGSLSGANSELVRNLQSGFNSMRQQNEAMSTRLAALHQQNNELSEVIRTTVNANYGFDYALRLGQSVEVEPGLNVSAFELNHQQTMHLMRRNKNRAEYISVRVSPGGDRVVRSSSPVARFSNGCKLIYSGRTDELFKFRKSC